MLFGLISTALVLLADQLSKYFLYGLAPKSIIGNVLWIESKFNTGIAFSLFEGDSYIFAALAVVASIVFLWLIFSKKFFQSKVAKIGLGLLLGGTIGNVIDRLWLGGVRDFISLRFIHYPIFNLADVAIVVGVILICIYIIFLSSKRKNKKDSETMPSSKEETND